MKTVWVLGAGFSRPLGGPLLPRLLSMASFNNLQSRFKAVGDHPLRSTASSLVVRLYAYGTSYQYGAWGTDRNFIGEDRWSDAEEFLDFLSTAEEGGDQCADAVRIRDMINAFHTTVPMPSIAELSAAARRLVAAECSLFLLDANTERESWEPYVQWAAGLNYDDTIVTFNYDLIPERLKLRAFMSGDDHDNPHEHLRIPRVFKMHGSVDWESFKDSGGQVRFKHHKDKLDYALTCKDSELSIGTPGPRKAQLSDQLQGIWRRAEEALRVADRIIFVGYRFPESDAQSKRRLLGAIGENRTKGNLGIQIVLGPQTEHPDVRRLKGLLQHSLTDRYAAGLNCAVQAEPLFSQDFLTVWKRP